MNLKSFLRRPSVAVLFMLAVWLFLAVRPTYAQDTAAPENAVTSLERAADMLMSALAGILAGAATAPITTTIVGLLKIPLPNNPKLLSFVVAALVTGLTWIAQRFGVDVQLKSLFDFIVEIVPAFTALMTTLAGSHLIYQKARQADVPVIGYSPRQSSLDVGHG